MGLSSRSVIVRVVALLALSHHVSGFSAYPLVHQHSLLFHSCRKYRNLIGNSIYMTNAAEAALEYDARDDKVAVVKKASKRDMLMFAIPALGIYLTNPLMSNIDNAFVGRTVGTSGLAALSPATICTDQMIYLFSFLSRATTGIVSRAYGAKENGQVGDTEAARESGSAPLTVSLICGALVSILYAFGTPTMLQMLNVNPSLRPQAASYIYWRGSITWAALAQASSLSMMMATRDAITPLKIVAIAAAVNIVSDYLLCVWPLQWGCAGAAAATSFATLLSCVFMLKALDNKGILPKIRMPTKMELQGLLDFTGPLLAVTLTRLAGFIEMQRTAMRLGTQSLAGYQLCINLLMFFLLFGEPLSQLSQTQLPALIDNNDGTAVYSTLKSILTLTVVASVGIGGIAYLAAMFGSQFVSTDISVQILAEATAPTLFCSVMAAIFAVAVDGAMLASRDFGFMLFWGIATFWGQLKMLPHCKNIAQVFATFAFRLSSYAVACLVRAALGYGKLGRVLRSKRSSQTEQRWD